jgi:hypothetical protein
LKGSKELDGGNDTNDDSESQKKVVVDLASCRITEIKDALVCNVLNALPTVLKVGTDSLVLCVGDEQVEILLDVGSRAVLPQIYHIFVKELVRIEVVVDVESM